MALADRDDKARDPNLPSPSSNRLSLRQHETTGAAGPSGMAVRHRIAVRLIRLIHHQRTPIRRRGGGGAPNAQGPSRDQRAAHEREFSERVLIKASESNGDSRLGS